MTIHKSFHLIKMCMLLCSSIVYSADRFQEALKCANAVAKLDLNSEQKVFECLRCQNKTFSSYYKYILHKHNIKECIPNKACIDCQLSSNSQEFLIKNNKAAIKHVMVEHNGLKKVHCYLCGQLVKNDLYKDHLNNKFHMLVKKVKTDISKNDNQFSVINNSTVSPTTNIVKSTADFFKINNALYKDE